MGRIGKQCEVLGVACHLMQLLSCYTECDVYLELQPGELVCSQTNLILKALGNYGEMLKHCMI